MKKVHELARWKSDQRTSGLIDGQTVSEVLERILCSMKV